MEWARDNYPLYFGITYFSEYPEQVRALAVFQHRNLLEENSVKELIEVYKRYLTN